MLDTVQFEPLQLSVPLPPVKVYSEFEHVTSYEHDTSLVFSSLVTETPFFGVKAVDAGQLTTHLYPATSRLR